MVQITHNIQINEMTWSTTGIDIEYYANILKIYILLQFRDIGCYLKVTGILQTIRSIIEITACSCCCTFHLCSYLDWFTLVSNQEFPRKSNHNLASAFLSFFNIGTYFFGFFFKLDSPLYGDFRTQQ